MGNILASANGTRPTSATPFDYGSGHLNPTAAMNPGLVYGFSPEDVIGFLCSCGASSAGLANLTGKGIECKEAFPHPYNLNYPSIGVAQLKGATTVDRTVKSVHSGRVVYEATVESPNGVVVKVVPERLEFSRSGEKKSFTVELVPRETSGGRFVFGSITWSDGTHTVRSPIGVNVVSL